MDLKKISIIVGLVLTLASVVGAGIAYDKELARKCDIEAVSARLDQKILADRVHNLQSRIWMLEGHYGGPGVPTAPPAVRSEYQQLLIELDRAKQKLRQMGG